MTALQPTSRATADGHLVSLVAVVIQLRAEYLETAKADAPDADDNLTRLFAEMNPIADEAYKLPAVTVLGLRAKGMLLESDVVFYPDEYGAIHDHFYDFMHSLADDIERLTGEILS